MWPIYQYHQGLFAGTEVIVNSASEGILKNMVLNQVVPNHNKAQIVNQVALSLTWLNFNPSMEK